MNVLSATDSQSYRPNRTMLKQIASAFDPLGLLSPVILLGNLLLQILWNQYISWVEHIPSENIKEWKDIQRDSQELPKFRFPRFIVFSQEVVPFACSLFMTHPRTLTQHQCICIKSVDTAKDKFNVVKN